MSSRNKIIKGGARKGASLHDLVLQTCCEVEYLRERIDGHSDRWEEAEKLRISETKELRSSLTDFKDQFGRALSDFKLQVSNEHSAIKIKLAGLTTIIAIVTTIITQVAIIGLRSMGHP